MSEHTKLAIINESPRSVTRNLDPKVLEHVFGKPTSPKSTSDSHIISNEKKHSQTHTNGNHGDSDRPSQPLLEPDRDKQNPPLAGPEIDDLDDEEAGHNNNNNNNNKTFVGIDDGLLDTDHKKPDIIDVGDESHDEGGKLGGDGDDTHTEDDHTNGLSPRFGEDRPVSPVPSAIDVNTYQQKKNLAQGMMDLALLSANANQLRYVLESKSSHPYYYSSVVFISLSILFQIAVGVGLIMNSRYDVNDKKEICKADKINNFTVLGIFLITIVNVFITSFSVATPAVLAS